MSDALPVLEVDLGPGVRAFFTTRAGGVSEGEHAALNLGVAVEDDPARVASNHELLAHEAGRRVAFGRQVHGADALDVEVVPRDGEIFAGTADALVTTRRDLALGVVVADCVPVLLADAARGVVATAHAGRAGLVAGVVESVVALARSRGARELRAVVGPAICGACYEFPAAMRDEVDAAVPGTASTTSWGTPALDLPRGVLDRLRAAGVERVGHLEACTFTDERFFSHRRSSADGTRRGRFAGVVLLG